MSLKVDQALVQKGTLALHRLATCVIAEFAGIIAQ